MEEQMLQLEWARAFDELLVTQGQDLCIGAYEGFLRTGSKGCVVVSEGREGGRD
jgi:hypothetical protein